MFTNYPKLLPARQYLVWLIFLLFLPASFTAEAAIYGHRDENGNVYITDNPPNDNYKILLTTFKRPRGFKEPVGTGRKYIDTIREFARKRELPYPLLLAIIKAESNFNPKAVSPKGARGLMQLMPGVCRQYGVTDPFNIEQNIRAGSGYFREMLDRFDDPTLAMAAYNAGPNRVIKYSGVPPFNETKRYIKKVKWYHDYYSKKKKLLTLPRASNEFDEGFQALEEGRLLQAARSFRRVVRIFPNSPEANYNLALAYDRTGNWTQAIAYYRKTLKVSPYFKEAYYNLAIIYERKGWHNRAICTWQGYMRYEVKPDEIRNAAKYIKELRQLSRQ